MKRIAIIGSGLLSKQYLHHIHTDTNHTVVGFFDDFKPKGIDDSGLNIIGKIDDVLSSFNNGDFEYLLIGIGYQHPDFKEKLFLKFNNIIPYYTFIHSSCIVDATAIINPGCVIYPGCIIDQHVEIESGVTINPGVMVGHNSKIGANTFIAGSASIAGFVTIGKKCFIGLNATFVDSVKISNNVYIAAGAVVIKNIENSGWYVGNPAKFLKQI